jgi:cobalt-zinc-cadmium efflux system outer membrane protein
MNRTSARPPLAQRREALCLCALAGLLLGACRARASAPPEEEAPPEMLSREAAVLWALQNNPELTALRQQHGVALGGIVIARTYPFNPFWEAKVRAAFGPPSAGVTNSVSNEHKVLMDVEVCGQKYHRRAAAEAALSRTDWEIAAQELAVAVRVARAFDTVVYRHQKKLVALGAVQLNQKNAEQVAALVKAGKLRPADQIILNSEIQDSRAQLQAAEAALIASWNDLRRALGSLNEEFHLRGELSIPPAPQDGPTVLRSAREHRADLRARQAAVDEAEARYRLEVANRFGNPNVGLAYEFDPTRINLVGIQYTLPLPLFNTHRGEILQRDSERVRAVLDLRQSEIQVQQDVVAALSRLERARAWADAYRSEIKPKLEAALKDFQELLRQGDPGIDAVRVLDVERKVLKARDGELDALFEARQAQADLAAAVGDPALAAALNPIPCDAPPTLPTALP